MNETPSTLINICTGRVASTETQQSLSKFTEKSKAKSEKFIEDVLIKGNRSFWQPVKKQKIFTFSEIKTKHSSALPKKFIGSEGMFRRIVAAAKFQSLDLSNILCYELTSVPLCLFHEDETMRKTTKSDLISKLEPWGQITTTRIVNSFLIDGMVLLQEMNEKTFNTFNELASIFLRNIFASSRKHGALRVTIVFDNYNNPNSTKSAERYRRGDCKETHTYDVSGHRKVVKFRTFLQLSENKRSLLKFLCNYILENSIENMTQNETLIIAGGFENPDLCYSINKENGLNELQELKCNHDEADTRLILHMLYEFQVHHCNNVLVKSVDTDVLILLIYYCSSYLKNQILEEQCSLYMELGHGNKKKIISISDIVQRLDDQVCKCLLPLHVITGCDTTNSFFKIGKKTAFDVFMKNPKSFGELEKLGTAPIAESFDIGTKFVLALFRNKNTSIKTLNQLRYHFSMTSQKSATELPPTDDSFQQHILR